MPVQKDPGKIRGMFAAISPRYDFLNHFLSLNIDRRWRRRAASELNLSPGGRCLDICTGTADLALEVARQASGSSVVGTDFTPEMLRLGEEKRRGSGLKNLSLLLADALRLPFPDAAFDAVTVAFGIRNLVDLEAGVQEMRRVLKPGGQAAILEFSGAAPGFLGRLFRFYFHHLLPRIGGWVTGSREGRRAYAYLPASVGEFLPTAALTRLLERSGFAPVRAQALALGIAHLHLATKVGAGAHHAAALARSSR